MLRSSGRHGWSLALAGLAGWALLTLAVVPTPAGAGSQVLSFNWPSQRDSDVTLTEIELTEAQIIITLRIRNRGSRPSRPRLFPPGHPLSFYILEKATGKRHYLAGSQGLAVDPDYTSLAPGRTLACKLFFNRIPLTSFSLLEGEPSLRGTVPNSIFWDFLDIDLAKLEKNFKSADRPPPKPDHIWNQPSTTPAKPEAKSAAPAPKPAQEKEPLKFFDNPSAQKQETEP